MSLRAPGNGRVAALAAAAALSVSCAAAALPADARQGGSASLGVPTHANSSPPNRSAASSVLPSTAASAPSINSTVGTPPVGSGIGSDPSASGNSVGISDGLVSNGFGSPACANRAALAALESTARVNCAASGLTTSSAPIGHYAFDIHIDVGPPKFVNLGVSLFEGLLLQPLWMGLLWLIGVVLVALQWCYSIDLLSPATLGPLADGLSKLHRAVTQPWLALALCFAAVAVAYHGLVRRRVAETLGQAVMMLAMMVAGLWIVVDPGGTIGQVHRLANDASLGALAVSSAGDAGMPQRGLDAELHDVFDSAVSGPWCYLEFGDVAWCRNAARLDPRLRAEGRRIATIDRAAVNCTNQSSFAGLPNGACASHDRLARLELTAQALALDGARTNGALFLALPPNSKPRNSINADAKNPSLLRTLCGSADATSCTQTTGPQAQFRTEQGMWPRAGGLLLIASGAAGMLALLGYLGLRLLASAILATLLLLLAPVAVLAPALGEGGRAGFRLWGTRLLGALVAKLVYTAFLGVVLLMLNVLESLPALGWWTQWLVIAAFWWIVFGYRHKILEHAIIQRPRQPGTSSMSQRIYAARQAKRLAGGTVRAAGAAGRGAVDVLRKVPNPDYRQPRLPLPRPRRADQRPPGVLGLEQIDNTLRRDYTSALETLAQAPQLGQEIGQREGRLQRVRSEGAAAANAGNRRREVSLALRAQALEVELEERRAMLEQARVTVPRGESLRRETGLVHDAGQRVVRGSYLDAQAALRPQRAVAGDRRGGTRQYEQLAPLAGLTRLSYLELEPRAQRSTRLEIDRRLEARRAEIITSRDSGTSRPVHRRPDSQRHDSDRPEPRQMTRRGRQFSRRFTADGG